MPKKSKHLRGQWDEENLEKALQALASGKSQRDVVVQIGYNVSDSQTHSAQPYEIWQ